MSDLKKRLREGNHLYAVADEAADRIEQLEATVEALMDLAGHAYIFCGVHDAPEQWLDVMFAGANGDDFTTEGLLPYTPPADPLVEWANRPLVYTSEVGEIKEFKIHTAQPQGDASPQVSGGGDLPEPAMVFSALNHGCAFSDGFELLDDTANFYSEAQMLAALSTPQARPDEVYFPGVHPAPGEPDEARPDGGAVLHLQIVDGIKREWAVSSQDGLWNLPAGKHLLYTHPATAPDVVRLVSMWRDRGLRGTKIGDAIHTCADELEEAIAAAQQAEKGEG